MSSAQHWRSGVELPTTSRRVTLGMLRDYAAASGDHNPIHTDPGFAAATPFGRPIAHGMLLLAYVMDMLTNTFGEAWITSGQLKTRFRKPAYEGSTISTWGTVKSVDAHTGSIRLTVGCRDQDGNELVTGTAQLELES